MQATASYISVGCNRASSVCDADPSGVVAFGAGRFVAVWNPADRKQRGISRTHAAHQRPVSVLKAFSTADRKGKGRVTSSTTGSNDGPCWISGDESGAVKVWGRDENTSVDDPSYRCNQTLADHKASTSALGSFTTSTGARVLLTGGSDAVVHVYTAASDADQFVRQQTIDLAGKLPLDIAIAALPGSPDTIAVAIALTDKRLQIWHGHVSSDASLQLTKGISLEGHEDWIRCLNFCHFGDELLLASGSQDGYIRLWRFAKTEGVAEQKERRAKKMELDDEMLDEFERKMAGEATGSRQLSTKSHIMRVVSGGSQVDIGVSLDALLIGHEGWVTNVRWSPAEAYSDDNPRLLSTSADNSMIIWATESSTLVWQAEHRFGEVGGRGLGMFGAVWAVSKEATSVIANGWNGAMNRWTLTAANEGDEPSWQPTFAPTGHSAAVKGLQWDPKEEYLLSVSSDQTTRAHGPWRRTTNGTSQTIWGEIGRPQIHGYDMTCVAFVDRLRFASGADEKIVRVFDAPQGFASSLTALGVTKGEVAASSTSIGAVVPPLGLSNRALNTVSEQPEPADDKGFNQEHVSISDKLSSLPTDAVLASSTLWPEVEKLYGHGYELMTITASPSRHLLATACKATSADHAVVRLYDTATWRPIGQPLAGHNLTITRISFSHDEQYVLTCSRDRTWRLFKRNGEDYVPLAAQKPHTRIIWDCAWGSDDKYFVTASRDKQVKFWASRSEDDATWENINTIKAETPTTAVAIIRHEAGQCDLLAVGHEGGAVAIYRVESAGGNVQLLGELASDAAHVEQVTQLHWRRQDGGEFELASASEDRSVRVHSIRL